MNGFCLKRKEEESVLEKSPSFLYTSYRPEEYNVDGYQKLSGKPHEESGGRGGRGGGASKLTWARIPLSHSRGGGSIHPVA